MFCPNCGKEIDDNADVCIKCGHVTPNSKLKETEQAKNNSNNPEPKSLGVVFGLFLGILGLIIGICIYSNNPTERGNFLKSWAITFFIVFITVLIIELCVA